MRKVRPQEDARAAVDSAGRYGPTVVRACVCLHEEASTDTTASRRGVVKLMLTSSVASTTSTSQL